jgi:hypothetical protein
LRRNFLIKHVTEGKIKKIENGRYDEEEEVRSYWTTLRKGKDTVS